VEDILAAVGWVHTSGIMHKCIIDNPQKYITKNDGLLETMKLMRQDNRGMFIITNSKFDYLNAGMNYLIDKNWNKLFE